MMLPLQMLSMEEKQRTNSKTGKNNLEETIDYYISQCGWELHINEVQKLYNAVGVAPL